MRFLIGDICWAQKTPLSPPRRGSWL